MEENPLGKVNIVIGELYVERGKGLNDGNAYDVLY